MVEELRFAATSIKLVVGLDKNKRLCRCLQHHTTTVCKCRLLLLLPLFLSPVLLYLMRVVYATPCIIADDCKSGIKTDQAHSSKLHVSS